jgi:hypothetical protein
VLAASIIRAMIALNTGIVGSNPTAGMDVCPHLSVLCCPVQAEALRRVDPLCKGSYQNSKEILQFHKLTEGMIPKR